MIQQNTVDSFNSWVEEFNLSASLIEDGAFIIEEFDGTFVIIESKDEESFEGEYKGKIFDERFELLISGDEEQRINDYESNYVAFEFGERWYYSDIQNSAQLKPLCYIGKPNISDYSTYLANLGIHSGYELLNGSRDYSDWCKKAKFLTHTRIGVCERNSIAGWPAFQMACEDIKIKPVFGMQTTVAYDDDGQFTYEVKLYVINEKGWRNLLQIHKALSIDHVGYVFEAEMLAWSEGLLCVIMPDERWTNDTISEFLQWQEFRKVFYQIDSVIWASDDKDIEYLNLLKYYFDNLMDKIDPILIGDSYYLEKRDAHIKVILNKVGTKVSHNKSSDQYFKTYDDHRNIFIELFPDEKRLDKILTQCVLSVQYFGLCEWSIKFGNMWIPKFEAIGQDIEDQYMEVAEDHWFDEYGTKHTDNEGLFYTLIERGMQEKIIGKVEDEDIYYTRLEEEIEVINEGGFQDYFLILWDINGFCKLNDILFGIGRGSVGGCLVAYLLDITQIDPIKFDLLFARFLNKSRIKKGMPDIDIDFSSSKRDEVKRYIERKYGYDSVACVGTYTTMKIKAALQDLARERGIDNKRVSYITSTFGMDESDMSWEELFKLTTSVPVLKDFIQNNYSLIEDIQLCLRQPKSASVHASAMIIVPKKKGKEDMTVFDWLPCKKVKMKDNEQEVIVTEWEGTYVEKIGFLKEDILSTIQLDKIACIFKMIKENRNEVIKMADIPLDDADVYELFKKGLSQDVFHFGSAGLIGYAQELKPENIEELIAMIALFRPGVMETGAHKQYVAIKFGKKKPEYDWGMKPILENTYGIMVYQEQAIKAVQVIGGLSEVDADNVRRAIGKKIQEEMDKWKTIFIEGAIKNGCPQKEANKIWDKIELFATYAFNKSHAAAYSITGYICNWLKFHYPIEFWTTALQFAKEDEIPAYANEINKLGAMIRLMPVEINKSGYSFYADYKTNNIYWSLIKVKQCGPEATNAIIEEREKNGDFYSLEEFCTRVPKAKVKKNIIENLILSGAFDEVELIENKSERFKLIRWLYNKNKDEIGEDYPKDKIIKEYFWVLKQKELAGLGYINFQDIVKSSSLSKQVHRYIDSSDFYNTETSEKDIKIVCGILKNIIERQPKDTSKDKFAQLELDCNDSIIYVTCWSDTYKQFRRELREAEEMSKIIIIAGNIKFDSYKKHNVLYTFNNSTIEII